MRTISSCSILNRRKRSQQMIVVPQFPSVPSVTFCRFLSLRPAAALGRRSDQIPTHFCPRLSDRIATSVNSTRASRSIAADTCSTRQTTPNTSRKLIENAILKTNIPFFLSSPKSETLGVSRSVSHAAATKPPTSVAFQRFSNIRDKIPAPQFPAPIHIRATQLQCQNSRRQSPSCLAPLRPAPPLPPPAPPYHTPYSSCIHLWLQTVAAPRAPADRSGHCGIREENALASRPRAAKRCRSGAADRLRRLCRSGNQIVKYRLEPRSGEEFAAGAKAADVWWAAQTELPDESPRPPRFAR
jgi:hypothetical protein